MTQSPATFDATYLSVLDSVDAVIYVTDMQILQRQFSIKKVRQAESCWFSEM